MNLDQKSDTLDPCVRHHLYGSVGKGAGILMYLVSNCLNFFYFSKLKSPIKPAHSGTCTDSCGRENSSSTFGEQTGNLMVSECTCTSNGFVKEKFPVI